jgi:hypothetical protein
VNDDCVRFDEREDVLASLGLLSLVAPRLKERPSYWKWIRSVSFKVLLNKCVSILGSISPAISTKI